MARSHTHYVRPHNREQSVDPSLFLCWKTLECGHAGGKGRTFILVFLTSASAAIPPSAGQLGIYLCRM